MIRIAELAYKCLSEIKGAIVDNLRFRNLWGVTAAICYSAALFGAAYGLKFGIVGGGLGAGIASSYNALRRDKEARTLELEYQTHLAKNDLPETR